MKNLLISLLCIVIFGGCTSTNTTDTKSTHTETTNTPTNPTNIALTFEELDKRFNAQDETIYVYNFWATWCKPCVKELPYFEQLGQEYADKKVKVILVSLDDVGIEDKVIKFAQDKGLKSEILLLNAGNPNDWIDKIDENWTGAIPATLVIAPTKNHRAFYQQDFDYNSLKALVDPLL